MNAPMLMQEERWTMPASLAAGDPYRFALCRRWSTAPLRVYVGLNPSTADAINEDATTRRWRAFCERDGFGGYIAVNCFPYRATDPRELVAAAERGIDLTGGQEGEELFQAMFTHPHVREAVACWGNAPNRKLEPRLRAIAELILSPALHANPVKCFGYTQSGQPKHPLYLPSVAALEAFHLNGEVASAT